MTDPQSPQSPQSPQLPHPPRHGHGWYCDELGPEIDRLADALGAADPATTVPTCPEWTVAELASHIGTIHRWAAEIVRRRTTERVRMRELDLGKPDDPGALASWVGAGAEPLVTALRDAPADQPVWVWGADPHVRFWSRRMLHESLVHRVDAALAAGQATPIATEVAVDGIDEFLDNLAPAAAFSSGVKDLRGGGETLHFHATDADGEWMITLEPDGFAWDHGHGKGMVAVRGPAVDLLLLLYRRRSLDETDLTVFGDDDVLSQWLAHSALE